MLNANLSPLPNWTYSADGEGRWNAVTASAGQNPVSSTTYNLYSELTAVNYGSLDSDAFTFDGNTGRMTQYKANVGSNYIQGALSWNTNGSLQQQVITDQVNASHSQTCAYTYDDLARLLKVDCGSGHWGQTYTYDAFGNMNRAGFNGGTSFALGYTASTNQISSYSYEANGNLTADNGTHTYSWDAEGKLYQLGSNTLTYDALGRRVEQSNAEILYAPSGAKLALMSGQTVSKMFVPLPGGATAVYAGTSLSYYRHPDWLGSSRVATTTARAVYYDGEYSPYGESYNETGTTDRNFTGQNQDLGANDLYDFLYREHNITQGRWISPDPAGMGAAHPTLPQSWNRYAYVSGDPTGRTDPLGLDGQCGPNGTWMGEGCYEYGGEGNADFQAGMQRYLTGVRSSPGWGWVSGDNPEYILGYVNFAAPLQDPNEPKGTAELAYTELQSPNCSAIFSLPSGVTPAGLLDSLSITYSPRGNPDVYASTRVTANNQITVNFNTDPNSAYLTGGAPQAAVTIIHELLHFAVALYGTSATSPLWNNNDTAPRNATPNQQAAANAAQLNNDAAVINNCRVEP